jgi:hypothetical protein
VRAGLVAASGRSEEAGEEVEEVLAVDDGVLVEVSLGAAVGEEAGEEVEEVLRVEDVVVVEVAGAGVLAGCIDIDGEDVVVATLDAGNVDECGVSNEDEGVGAGGEAGDGRSGGVCRGVAWAVPRMVMVPQGSKPEMVRMKEITSVSPVIVTPTSPEAGTVTRYQSVSRVAALLKMVPVDDGITGQVLERVGGDVATTVGVAAAGARSQRCRSDRGRSRGRACSWEPCCRG